MRSRLDAISESEALAAGEGAIARLADWSGWQSASTIAVFATMPGEIDTEPVIERARDEGRRIVFPRMIAGSTLEFVPVDRPEQLGASRHAVKEPDVRIPARPLPVDAIVLVPGLAFDREGGRLGRGAGYYDRALADYAAARARPTFIGLAFAVQIVDVVPRGSLDVTMDGVVTEAEFTART